MPRAMSPAAAAPTDAVSTAPLVAVQPAFQRHAGGAASAAAAGSAGTDSRPAQPEQGAAGKKAKPAKAPKAPPPEPTPADLFAKAHIQVRTHIL